MGNFARKLVLVCSVTLAILLLALWALTRHYALIASSASGGTYRELRISQGDIAATLVPAWPVEESLLIGVKVATTQRAAKSRRIHMLDDTIATLNPTSTTRWTPVASSGTLYLEGTPWKHNRMLATNGGTLTLTAGALNIPATTMPANAVSAGTITFSPNNIAITSNTGTVISGGTITSFTIIPSYAYQRYAVPLWLAVVIVLLPLWWALLFAMIRLQRRRGRLRAGLCLKCGYDLRGRPDAPCPECGTAHPDDLAEAPTA
jgi:hypothetical protein